MKKFKIVTLGCRTNQYETAAYADQLEKLGFSRAVEEEPADICIVNTCSVTQSADSRSLYQIRKLAKENPKAKLLITGCFAEHGAKEIEAIPGVSFVTPNGNKEKLLQHLFPEEELPEFAIEKFQGHTRAFVKVQDGCNSFCSYCVIPYVRGRSKSRPIAEILKECQSLIKNGHKEIVLTGINIGDFGGRKRKESLADLVKAVDALPGLKRLRISSIDPDEVDDTLLDAVIHGKATCPSMHIVLQSGSNAILKGMNRKYTRNDFLKTIERIKKARPDFTFTTDIIVGFPGETEEDFLETLEVMRQVRFAKVHMFPYSKRHMTRAASFPGHLPEEVIHRRKQTLLDLSQGIAFDLREQYIGKKVQVLLESSDEKRPGYITGHSEHFFSVSLPEKGLRKNTIVDAVCIANEKEGLLAKTI